jgi:hypothetical protein
LATIAVSALKPNNWRAAWVLQSMLRRYDPRLFNHIDGIIAFLPIAEDGHQRELLKVLYIQELSGVQKSQLFDSCITLWETLKKALRLALPLSNKLRKPLRNTQSWFQKLAFF